MYCPSCGTEISVELKYCNRCGANLATVPESKPVPVGKPVKVTLPAIILGLTITIGIGVTVSSAAEMAQMHLPPAAIVFIVVFGLATLFGCTALMLRFWLKVLSMNRETYQQQPQIRPPVQAPAQLSEARQQFQPRLEPAPSVTEHTTRTFSPAYKEGSDPAAR
ncbi:MAG: zinc ribbon domain-containing protein [Acidobacteriota bacterium]